MDNTNFLMFPFDLNQSFLFESQKVQSSASPVLKFFSIIFSPVCVSRCCEAAQYILFCGKIIN